MSEQHYLGNKKPTFLSCKPKQVYAAILEFLKTDLFQNCQTYPPPIKEISQNFLDMVSVNCKCNP